MTVFRLAKGKYAQDLSGVGASLFGYRWNSKGIKVVYTASSRALAMAEVLVHLPLDLIPSGYVIVEIEIPEYVGIEEIDVGTLKDDWNRFSHATQTKQSGDDFFRACQACVMEVPSAVVQGDYNFILNPLHEDMEFIKVVNVSDFPFEKRIFKSI